MDAGTRLEELSAAMHAVMADCVLAARELLCPQRLEHCFEIFGFDFMVDHTLRLWLIEVNTNPCMDLCNALLATIIPSMLEATLVATVDTYGPPKEGENARDPPCPAKQASPSKERRESKDAPKEKKARGWKLILDPSQSEVQSVIAPCEPCASLSEVDRATLGRRVLGKKRRGRPSRPPSGASGSEPDARAPASAGTAPSGL